MPFLQIFCINMDDQLTKSFSTNMHLPSKYDLQYDGTIYFSMRIYAQCKQTIRHASLNCLIEHFLRSLLLGVPLAGYCTCKNGRSLLSVIYFLHTRAISVTQINFSKIFRPHRQSCADHCVRDDSMPTYLFSAIYPTV